MAEPKDSSHKKDQWLDKPIDDVIKELEQRGVSSSLTQFLKDQRELLKAKPALKYIQPYLNVHELIKGGVGSYAECLKLFDYLEEIKVNSTNGKNTSPKALKIFNDPIHGHVQLHPACHMIVDTLQFQRLRDIKQLGTVFFVYPGAAAHSRYEHSLGVCHLAGQFARALRESQPELGITDVDILCVEIAGLCRDLGQGPFSRLYVSLFLPSVNSENKQYKKPSASMFEYLLKYNNLTEKLEDFGILETDLLFIKELITGPKPTGSTAWPYKGRPMTKSFLYEIVSNRRNGIGVNKWDYLARDCHHLGIKNNFDASRYTIFARVIEVEGELQICIRDKEICNLYNMFYTRYTVNKFAYSHKVTCGIELMIVKMLQLASPHISFTGEDGNKRCIKECYSDMRALSQLTDNVLFIIFNADLGEEHEPRHEQRYKDLKEAKSIFERILNRNLYTCAYETPPMKPNDLKDLKYIGEADSDAIEDKITQAITDKIKDKDYVAEHVKTRKTVKNVEDILKLVDKEEIVIVKKIHLDFGMKEENPVERLKVYSKHDLRTARHLKKEEVSRILGPVNFNEVVVRVYSTDRDDDVRELIAGAARQILKVEPNLESE